jgi:hypothetical protein
MRSPVAKNPNPASCHRNLKGRDRRVHPAGIPLGRLRQQSDPAYIPQEVGGNPRWRAAIPARRRSKRPAHGENPRPFPASPATPRPSCHAGGRGFESRRSRKRPANRLVLLRVKTQETAGCSSSRAHPAPGIAGQSRLHPLIPARGMTSQLAGRLGAAACRPSRFPAVASNVQRPSACLPRRFRAGLSVGTTSSAPATSP